MCASIATMGVCSGAVDVGAAAATGAGAGDDSLEYGLYDASTYYVFACVLCKATRAAISGAAAAIGAGAYDYVAGYSP